MNKHSVIMCIEHFQKKKRPKCPNTTSHRRLAAKGGGGGGSYHPVLATAAPSTLSHGTPPTTLPNTSSAAPRLVSRFPHEIHARPTYTRTPILNVRKTRPAYMHNYSKKVCTKIAPGLHAQLSQSFMYENRSRRTSRREAKSYVRNCSRRTYPREAILI